MKKTMLKLFLILILVGIIIYCYAKYGGYKDFVESELLEYKVLTSNKTNNICLQGCVKGVCEKQNNNPLECKYNFQCSYCQDKDTNMFYVAKAS